MRKVLICAVTAGALGLRAQEAPVFEASAVLDALVQRNELARPQGGPDRPAPGSEEGWRQHQTALTLSSSLRFAEGPSLALSLTGRDVTFYQQASDLTLERPDRSLYRKSLTFQWGGFTARAGDFHALLGKGLVLSVLPIDKLLKERTIEGGEVRWQTDRVEVRALGGRVQTETRDQAWRVQGGELRTAFLTDETLGTHRLGFHAARIDDEATAALDPIFLPLLRERRTHALSLGGDGVGKVLDYYVEEARLSWARKPDDFTEILPGRATYANLTLRPGTLFVLGEYRRYERFETDLLHPENTLNNPPLADRDDEKNNLLHSEVARLLLQVAGQDPAWSVFVSGGSLKENGGGPFDPVKERGHDVYGGFTLEELGDWFSCSATYGVRKVQYPERRTDAAMTFRFTPRWSLELKVRDKRHVDALDQLVRESDYDVQLSCSPRFSLYLRQQYRTDPGKHFKDHWFPSGGFRVNLWKGSYVDLSGGSIRGGLVCSGGQCREMPDFKGWKLATHFVFR